MDIEVDQDLVQSSSRDNKKGRAAGAHVVERVLVKDDNYIVTERRSLPVEVQQAISLAGQSLSLSPCLLHAKHLLTVSCHSREKTPTRNQSRQSSIL